ncbi:hypothetical protein LOD99_14338 [Oopsacas minuta]|uniref:Uncharacterized protein n=1 Tax=Oopsacas minuta TaxID=111878 RepID=A0AAV7KFH3_9METZ|nr:hypothetical protein LOD99_14338 [Oopsacas minuta]
MTTEIPDQISPIKSEKDSKYERMRHEPTRARRKSFATMKDAVTTAQNYPTGNITKKPIISCSYSEMGCDFYVSKDKLEELMKHTNEKGNYHLQITTEAYKKMKSENGEIRKKYDKLKSDWNAYHMQVGVYNSDRTHSIKDVGKLSVPDMKRSSGERKISPGYHTRKISTPKEYTGEKRLSGGKVIENYNERIREKERRNSVNTTILTNIEINPDKLDDDRLLDIPTEVNLEGALENKQEILHVAENDAKL